MEGALNSALFQRELRAYGLSDWGAALIRSQNGVVVVRVRYGNGSAVLKYFENPVFRREIRNYEILQGLGIPTPAVLGKTESSLLLEDLSASKEWRLGREEDLGDPAVIRAVAKWYRSLHSRGAGYAARCGAGMYEEWERFTRDNLEALRERFGLRGNPGLEAVADRFEELRARLDAAPRTLAYNDFYYTNLAVRKDRTEALMFDYNLLGKGSPVSDIRNVVYWFSEEHRRLFFSEYGEPDPALLLLDEICAPVVSLVLALDRVETPAWAAEAVEELQRVPALLAELRPMPPKEETRTD